MFDMEMYFDDSGTHEGSPIAIAACYVASREQWREFVRNWDEARVEEGFDVFHMTDFMARPERGIKPFCGWDKRKRRHVYFRLASIINTRVRTGFGFGVPTEAYDKYAPEFFKKEMASDAFNYAVQCLMGVVQQWYQKFGQGKAIQFVFEDRKRMGNVRQVFDLLREKPEYAEKFGFEHFPDGLSFQSPKIFKPLQAADIFGVEHERSYARCCIGGAPGRSKALFRSAEKKQANKSWVPVRGAS
jgi:hypothetical protein